MKLKLIKNGEKTEPDWAFSSCFKDDPRHDMFSYLFPASAIKPFKKKPNLKIVEKDDE